MLSYDNAKLAHALILSGRAMGQTPVYERGLQALRWLAKVQTAESGDFRPIGSNGFFPRGGARADFDQQPIEAHSMLSACLEAYRATSDAWGYEQAQRTFDWFLGWNDLGPELYSPNTGGCRDALHVDRVNQNQGAESTLAFLLSLAELPAHAKRGHRLQPARFVTPPSHEDRYRPAQPRHPASRPLARAAPAVSSSERSPRRQNLRPGHGPPGN